MHPIIHTQIIWQQHTLGDCRQGAWHAAALGAAESDVTEPLNSDNSHSQQGQTEKKMLTKGTKKELKQ